MGVMKPFLTLAIIVLLLVSCVNDDDTTADPGLLTVGTIAPAFTIYPDEYPLGLSLSDLQGRYVVIQFWASWCPDCQAITDDITALYRTYHSEDIVFLGYSFDTDETQWRSYIADHGMSWIQYSEFLSMKDSPLAALYDVHWIPSFYLLGPDATILCATVDISSLATALADLPQPR